MTTYTIPSPSEVLHSLLDMEHRATKDTGAEERFATEFNPELRSAYADSLEEAARVLRLV